MAKPKKAVKNNPYNISYEEVCAEVMGPKQKEQLRRMIGFRFKRHESINLPEEHLQAIEKHLEGRVRKLLAIPTRHKRNQFRFFSYSELLHPAVKGAGGHFKKLLRLHGGDLSGEVVSRMLTLPQTFKQQSF